MFQFFEPPQEVLQALADLPQWTVISHINPDGDTLGCGSAMVATALALGKPVEWLGRDELPVRYAFLPHTDRYRPCGVEAVSPRPCIWLDISDIARGLKGLECSVAVNIDHHPTNPGFGGINWVQPCASATAELIWPLICRLCGDEPPQEAATALYAALVTDNGNFSYPSTTPRSFDLARQLVERGADPAEIDRKLNRQERLEKLKLWGLCLSRAEVVGQRGVISWVSQADFDATGALLDETEELVNQLTRLGCADMAVLAIERPGLVRCSFRSRPPLSAQALAESFGGGGHPLAAGARLDGTLSEGLVRLKKAMIDHERLCGRS